MYGADIKSNTREVAVWIFYKPYLPKWGIWQTATEVSAEAVSHDSAGLWEGQLYQSEPLQ
jgi:hypothetical protein